MLCENLRLIPLSRTNEQMQVAMINPLDQEAARELSAVTGLIVKVAAIITPLQLGESIETWKAGS